MSKKYKGKTCVYCCVARASSTNDHVFARQFILHRPAGNAPRIPQVPACANCNGNKSELEHYLATVLPFGSYKADGVEMMLNRVSGRLDKNERLRSTLAASMNREALQIDAGEPTQTMTISFEWERLVEYFKYVVRGLAWHHWQLLLTHDGKIDVAAYTPAAISKLQDLASQIPGQRVTGNIGDGAFEYAAMRAAAEPQLTIWVFKVFGGAVFAGDPGKPDVGASLIGVTTYPKKLRGDG